MYRAIILVLLFVSSATFGLSQRGYEIGGWIGVSQYYGELNSNINFTRPGLAAGVIGKFNYNTRVSTQLSINYGRLRGSDETASNNFERNRNLHFYSNVWDVNLGLEFNFLNYVHNSTFENHTPFITAGISLTRFNPKATLEDQSYTLRSLGTEGQEPNEEYLLLTMGPSIGVGYKWDIAKDWYMSISAKMQFPMTDYLDDVSTVYPDYDDLESLRGEEAVQLSNRTLNEIAGLTGKQRGNSTNNDKYLFLGISVMKYFGRLDCPPISRILE